MHARGSSLSPELPGTTLSAAANGDLEKVKNLIDKGTDVNAQDKDWATPLHRAAENGHREVAELLIAAGANVNAKTRTAWTPLHYALSEGHEDVAELLIAKGAEMNARSDPGWTPLHYAVSGGHVAVVELLVSKGADMNAVEKYAGDTPLDVALRFQQKDIADFLRKHGAVQRTGGGR